MIKEHTKRLVSGTADSFANKEADWYLKAEAVQFVKEKDEMHAIVVSVC